MKKIIMKLFANKKNDKSKCDDCGYKNDYEELEIKYNSLLEENYNLKNKLKTTKAETAEDIARRLKSKAILKCFDPLIGSKICISEYKLNKLVKEYCD